MTRFAKLLTTSVAILVLANMAAPLVSAQESLPPETVEPEAPEGETLPQDAIEAAARLLALIQLIDEDAELSGNGAVFTLNETTVTLVFDVNADRMRLVSPVGLEAGLSQAQLRRLMQANFDSALDARYAIAQDLVWATFIHPLSSLTEDDFISGIAQTVTLVETYGTTFTSGKFVFGGGDSNGELQDLLDRLLDKGRAI